MATYLPGVQPFIPDYQPFQPDLNFYANTLQTKQTQYDTNWKHLNDVYGKYFYADVLRPGDQEKKDKLIKDIDFELKRVSGLDLSLQQNLQQATQVFRPFYEDKTLMHDMAYTANFKQDRGAAMALKNNVDEKKAGKYWNEGIEFMDIMKDKFVNSSDQESLTMWSPEYTPYVNAIETYTDLAKKLDIKADIVTPGPQWMVRQRNGDLIYEPLVNIFKSEYANNPGLQEVYKVQSVVNRNRSIKKYMANDNLDAVGAERKYLQEQNTVIQEYLKRMSQEANSNVKQKEKEIDEVNKDIKNGSDNLFTNDYKNSLEQSEAYAKSVWAHVLKVKKQADDKPSSTVVTSQGVDPDPNLQTLAAKVDAGTAMMLANQDIADAAYGYSRTDMLVDYEANPFAVVNSKNAAKKEQIRLKNNLDREAARIERAIANGIVVENWMTGELTLNDTYTKTELLDGASYTSEEITNIEAANAKARFTSFNEDAKPGLIAMGEYLAKLAADGQLNVSQFAGLFEDVSDVTDKQAQEAAMDIDPTFQKRLDKGDINSPLSGQAKAMYYMANPNSTKVSEDAVRQAFSKSGLASLYYGDEKRMSNLYNNTMSIASALKGKNITQQLFNNLANTKINDYMILNDRMAEVNDSNREVFIKNLKSSNALDGLDLFQNENLKNAIADNFLTQRSGSYGTEGNEKVSREDFKLLNTSMLKEASEKGFGPQTRLTIAGQQLKVDDPSYKRIPGGMRGGKSYPGNFSEQDNININKLVQKRLSIDSSPTTGASGVAVGTRKANIKLDVEREYANRVNKLIDVKNNPEPALDKLYDDLSRVYSETAQNSRELISFDPQVYNKGNKFGITGIMGMNVPLYHAGSEGTKQFNNAMETLAKINFTDKASIMQGNRVVLGAPLTKTGFENTTGLDSEKAAANAKLGITIAKDLRKLIGSGAKGNSEKPKGMDITIGALANNALGTPGAGAVLVGGIDYQWLYDTYVKTREGGDIGMLTADQAKGIATNGIYFSAPYSTLSGLDVMQTATLDPLERVIISGGKVEYYDPNNSGFYTIKENIAEGSPHVVNGKMQYLDDDGKYKTLDISSMLPTDQYNLSNLSATLRAQFYSQTQDNLKTMKELQDKGMTITSPPELK